MLVAKCPNLIPDVRKNVSKIQYVVIMNRILSYLIDRQLHREYYYLCAYTITVKTSLDSNNTTLPLNVLF